jgi:hypothetical protein
VKLDAVFTKLCGDALAAKPTGECNAAIQAKDNPTHPTNIRGSGDNINRSQGSGIRLTAFYRQ